MDDGKTENLGESEQIFRGVKHHDIFVVVNFLRQKTNKNNTEDFPNPNPRFHETYIWKVKTISTFHIKGVYTQQIPVTFFL